MYPKYRRLRSEPLRHGTGRKKVSYPVTWPELGKVQEGLRRLLFCTNVVDFTPTKEAENWSDNRLFTKFGGLSNFLRGKVSVFADQMTGCSRLFNKLVKKVHVSITRVH